MNCVKCNRKGVIGTLAGVGKLCAKCFASIQASEAQPPQAVTASASCSAASASEARDNEADSSSRSARESGLIALEEAVKSDMMLSKSCLDTYLRKGFSKHAHYARGQLDALQSVLNRIKEARSDAPPAAGERALARNDQAHPTAADRKD